MELSTPSTEFIGEEFRLLLLFPDNCDDDVVISPKIGATGCIDCGGETQSDRTGDDIRLQL